MAVPFDVAGTIKFKSTVPVSTLASIIQGWKAQQLEPERWVDLHVRPAGRFGDNYIGFRCVTDGVTEKIHDQFLDSLISDLRRRLGVDEQGRPIGVRGWSMSSVVESA